MSSLIAKINTADRLAELCRQGTVAALVVWEHLIDLGFSDIELGDKRVSAVLDGVRYDLGRTA